MTSRGFQSTILIAGFVVGLLIGYVPAQYVVEDTQINVKHMQNNKEFVEHPPTLRGVIRDVNQKTKTFLLEAVSPYSLNEKANFRIHMDEKMLVRHVQPILRATSTVPFLAGAFEIPALSEGLTAAVVITRQAGDLRAQAVYIGPAMQTQ
ncbi:hypothetical protein A3A39_02225 [Candidatus Kaiserbacteria bacterium RIFCSPLOWO2_01_FULL_54_13]|uniref:Uncharacterized protein n=1 Tax=Candidatus Kaiserbacteria bacterium RIFCSPLOWO2_01_FULL_54_13 TaxID=1798512 RepID=A0A1F6F192_9BACT|nr:MAG: hypothetical protein A3A39_02225 [Candidatus Kaiserbacteria bacterium RIFCSPLOWO2_01_FULL_54_13]